MEERRPLTTRQRILDALNTLGEVKDPAGRCVRLLWEYLDQPGSYQGFGATLYQMEVAGAIEREIIGKRTYAVHLTPTGAEQATTEPVPPAEPAAPATAPAISTKSSARPAKPSTKTPATTPIEAMGPDELDALADRLLVRVLKKINEEVAVDKSLRARNAELVQKIHELEHSLELAKEGRQSAEDRVKGMSMIVDKTNAKLRTVTMERNRFESDLYKLKGGSTNGRGHQKAMDIESRLTLEALKS